MGGLKHQQKEKCTVILAIYHGVDEVLVFEVLGGDHVGKGEFFNGTGREEENYRVEIVEAPLCITNKGLSVESERVIDSYEQSE